MKQHRFLGVGSRDLHDYGYADRLQTEMNRTGELS